MRVSGSRLSLLEHCLFWARDDVDAPPDAPSTASDTGKMVHSLIEVSQVGGMPEIPPLADTAEAGKLFNTWRPWWKEYSADRPWRYEVPFLYDWQTGRAREETREWTRGKRERGPSELPAIVDAISTSTILDWKSGKNRTLKSKDSHQLKLAALAASTLYNWPEVTVGLVYLKIRKNDPPELATFDALELADFGGWIRDKMNAREGAKPAPGEHCWRCPLSKRNKEGIRPCPALDERVDFETAFGKDSAA